MKPGDLVSVYLNDEVQIKTGIVIRASRKVIHVGEVLDVLVDGEVKVVLRENIHIQATLRIAESV
jgi:translation initiation factor IF-1